VQYDRLIELTRAEVEREHERPLKERAMRELVFRLFPYRRRLRALRGPLRLYQKSGLERLVRRSGVLERVSPSVAAMERLAPPLGRAPRLPERVAARGARRATVAMLTGCVQGEFFPGVNAATPRPGPRRVRRAHPQGAGMLRSAVPALRPRGGGPRLRPPDDRDV